MTNRFFRHDVCPCNARAASGQSPPIERVSRNNASTGRLKFSSRSRSFRPRYDGFTLLEVVLALALSVIILFSISMAIYLHLSVLDRRRGKIERTQLARNILQLMAKDIRSAVQYKPVDVSQLEQMMAGADLTSLLGSEAAAAALGATTGGDSEPTGTIADLEALAAGMTPSNTGGSSAPTMPDLTGMGLGGEDAGTAAEDIASSVAPPTAPGIYGNELELMVDTSKLPRKDQYNPMLAANITAATDIPSDIKTVAYYLQQDASDADVLGDPFSSSEPTQGLARREVARAVARFAYDNGNSMEGLGKVDLIAPEVTSLSFQYFDGTDWLTEWDSEATGSLPFAIEITLGLTSQQNENRIGLYSWEQENEEEVFRLVVHIPMAEEPAEEEPATDGLPVEDGSGGEAAAPEGAAPETGGTGASPGGGSPDGAGDPSDGDGR